MNLIAHSYKALASGTAAGLWLPCPSRRNAGNKRCLMEVVVCSWRLLRCAQRTCFARRCFLVIESDAGSPARFARAGLLHAESCRENEGFGWIFVFGLELLRPAFQNTGTRRLLMLCTDSPLAAFIGLLAFIAKKDKTKKKIFCTTTKGLQASEVCARACVFAYRRILCTITQSNLSSSSLAASLV